MERRAIATALALAVLLTIAACGGDDSGEQLTKEEFIAAADEICREADEKNDALAEPETLDDATSFLQDGLVIQEEQLAELEALTHPA